MTDNQMWNMRVFHTLNKTIDEYKILLKREKLIMS